MLRDFTLLCSAHGDPVSVRRGGNLAHLDCVSSDALWHQSTLVGTSADACSEAASVSASVRLL